MAKLPFGSGLPVSRRPPRKPEELPYRPCVGVMLIGRDGRVFVGRRKSEAGPEHVANGYAWQMPQGGIDPGEDPTPPPCANSMRKPTCAPVRLLAEAPDWYAYDLPALVAGRAWKGRYRGQTQKWFAFRFEGEEAEIDIARPAEGRHGRNSTNGAGNEMERLPELIIPFKRAVYENVVGAFRHLAGAPD